MEHKVIAADVGQGMGFCMHPKPGMPQTVPHGAAVALPPVYNDDDGPMLDNLESRFLQLLFLEPVMLIKNSFGQSWCVSERTKQKVQPYYTIFVYEAALPTNIKDKKGKPISTLKTGQRQLGRGGVMTRLACALGLETYDIALSTVRSAFCTSPRRGSGREAEDTGEWVMRNCRDIGWYPQDHNVADAMALFDYTCNMKKQPFPRHAGPLFKPQVRL